MREREAAQGGGSALRRVAGPAPLERRDELRAVGVTTMWEKKIQRTTPGLPEQERPLRPIAGCEYKGTKAHFRLTWERPHSIRDCTVTSSPLTPLAQFCALVTTLSPVMCVHSAKRCLTCAFITVEGQSDCAHTPSLWSIIRDSKID